MTRILADLPDDDIEWLDALAARTKRSRAAAIRDAVKLYLLQNADNEGWIERGAGYWKDRTDIGDARRISAGDAGRSHPVRRTLKRCPTRSSTRTSSSTGCSIVSRRMQSCRDTRGTGSAGSSGPKSWPESRLTSAARCEQLIAPFEIVEVDARIAAAAADIRHRMRMKLLDAIILATAQVTGRS